MCQRFSEYFMIIYGCSALSFRVITIGCCVMTYMAIKDVDFQNNCIGIANISFIAPQSQELQAMLFLPLVGIILNCCHCCFVESLVYEEKCYKTSKLILCKCFPAVLIIEIVGQMALVSHCSVYFYLLKQKLSQLNNYDCLENDDFHSAYNWLEAGMLITIILVVLTTCFPFAWKSLRLNQKDVDQSEYDNGGARKVKETEKHVTKDIEVPPRNSINQMMSGPVIGNLNSLHAHTNTYNGMNQENAIAAKFRL